MTRTRLRHAVLRDLAWLLNATNIESEIDLDEFPAARAAPSSTYGVEALSGRRVADVDWQDLEHAAPGRDCGVRAARAAADASR